MTNGRTETALVVPCYNESSRLDVDALVEFALGRDWLQLILVDDGSTDDTAAAIDGAVRRAPDRVRALREGLKRMSQEDDAPIDVDWQR